MEDAYISSPRHIIVADHDSLGRSCGAAGVNERACHPGPLGVDAFLYLRIWDILPELQRMNDNSKHSILYNWYISGEFSEDS